MLHKDGCHSHSWELLVGPEVRQELRMRGQLQCGALTPGTAVSGSWDAPCFECYCHHCLLKLDQQASIACQLQQQDLLEEYQFLLNTYGNASLATQSIQRLLLPGIKGCLTLLMRQPTCSSQIHGKAMGSKSSFPALFLTLKCHRLLTL